MPRLFALIALVAATLFVAAPAHAASNQMMTFEAPAQLLDDSARPATLDEIQAFGVTTVRVLAYWNQFSPDPNSKTKPKFDASDPDAYPAGTWDRLDHLFADTQARGMKVLLTLTGPVPKWATKAKKDNISDPIPAEFQAWATAVGRRYGSVVDIWSIWNEPNHPQFLGPQFVKGKAHTPALYRSLFFAGVNGLRSTPANLDDKILMGETAPRGTPNVVAPLAFLRGTLCLNSKYKKVGKCLKMPADGYAHHAYTTKAGPRFVPPAKDDVTIGVLSRLTTALDKAAKAGAIDKNMGVYLTEFGIQSEPDPFVGVTLEQQAEYLATSERIAYANSRVRSFSQYLLQDDQPKPGPKLERYSGFESGLKYADGKAKPSYDGFRLPLAVSTSGKNDVLWGLVRPDQSKTSVSVEIADKGHSFHTLKSVATNANGVWGLKVAHKKGRHFRVVWTSPSGQVYTGASVTAY